ncbi:aminoglycoside phosphotransferase family protein [Mycolicibacterium litorale]|uniref:aminoglycoside phosphotransferase family protein n=1 Tax=Mycolicibacterium litorale TaxID=758802 RepID=UPI003CFACC6F
MTDLIPPTKATLASVFPLMRVGAAVVADKVRRPIPTSRTDVPADIRRITPSWMTEVLQSALPRAVVEDVAVHGVTRGTSVRAHLELRYRTERDGFPATMFAKSTPTLTTRIANGLTGTASTEAGFYRQLRPQLDLEAPRGFHSAFDRRSWRSIQIIEDLVATRGATFGSPAHTITFEDAEQIVGQLAKLHAQGSRVPEVTGPRPEWLCTYPQWWRRALSVVNVKTSHLRAVKDGVDNGVLPAELRGRGDDLWERFIRSVDAHRHLPLTVIHGDVHLGNWYTAADGSLGLCDWQCVSAGHWSRDLAYALVSTLGVDQRRAWERDLIRIYLDLLGRSAEPVRFEDAWRMYRLQLLGALMMWTPTYRPPPLMPEMQPVEVSEEMLRRMGAAIVDLDALSA